MAKRKRLFWALAALGLALGALGLWYIRTAFSTGSLPLLPCLFHSVTGLYCAGCGMTRALHFIMEGRLYEALRMNPLGVLSAPFLTWAALAAIYRAALNRPMPNVPSWAPWTILAVIILYTVARNLPWEPFCWLAPTLLG